MVKKGKKSQSGILTTVLIILIVIILIAIVWNVVVPLVKEKSKEAEFGQFAINLEIQDVVLFENGVSMVSVNRKSGNEKLDGLKFVFYDEAGNSATRDKEAINELETKTYSFSAVSEIGKISKVGVVPIINGNLGMLIESKPEEVLKIPSNLVSWWRFDDYNDFIFGNVCEKISGEGIINGALDGEVNCSVDRLNLIDKMAISFWVKGNSNEEIITKGEGYKIIVVSKKIKFVSGGQEKISNYELNNSWNHVVVSIDVGAISKIYVNNKVTTFLISFFNSGEENLIINGEIDEVMIFDKPITNIEGIYNTQKKD